MTARYEWPEPREGEERLVCPQCGSPHLVEVSSGWAKNAAFLYRDDDEVDYDTGKQLDSDADDLWFACQDCSAVFWDGGDSLLLESEWKAAV